MKAIYYDCFAGISGDMNLGAMVDLGADKDALVAELRKLKLDGWKLEFSRDSRAGIFGTKAEVVLDAAHRHEHAHEHHHRDAHADAHAHSHEHRAYSDIVKIVEESEISERAKELSLAIFEKIAAAEAKIHGTNVADVKFHEVGALDSIIDIVGAAVCADLLGAEKFACSAVELGGGTVRCAHGVMPVPRARHCGNSARRSRAAKRRAPRMHNPDGRGNSRRPLRLVRRENRGQDNRKRSWNRAQGLQ